MTVFLHVLIALASIGSVTFAYVRPTAKKLYITYSLVFLTFATGFFMVLTRPAHMIEMCTTGVAYLAIVSLGIVMARRKLAVLQLQKTRAAVK